MRDRASITATKVYVKAKQEAVELAAVELVSCLSHHCLLKPLCYAPPTEAEANYYMQLNSRAITA